MPPEVTEIVRAISDLVGQAAQAMVPGTAARAAARADQPPLLVSRPPVTGTTHGNSSKESTAQVEPVEVAVEALRHPQSTLLQLAVDGPREGNTRPEPVHHLDPQGKLQGLRFDLSWLQQDDPLRLAAALLQNTRLTGLSLACEARQAAPILIALASHPGLRQLEWSPPTLVEQDLMQEAISALCAILHRSSQLQSLALIGKLLVDDDFRQLTHAVERNTSLTALRLEGLLNVPSDWALLTKVLQSKQNIVSLAFPFCWLMNEGGTLPMMANLLRLNPNIRHLNLVGNLMDTEDLPQFVEALWLRTEMRSLRFSCGLEDDLAPLSDELVNRWLEALQLNTRFEALDFGSIALSLEGARAFCKFFETSAIQAPLREIHLPSDVDPKQARALKERLCHLQAAIDWLAPMQRHALATLALHVPATEPYFPQDLLNAMISTFAVVPNGKDALLSLARVMGFELPVPAPSDTGQAEEERGKAERGQAKRGKAERANNAARRAPQGLLQRRRARKHRKPPATPQE